MNEFITQFKDQFSRIWGQLNPQQKMMFISAPVILLISMTFAVYFASRPEWVTLVSTDDAKQLYDATMHLDTVGIKYQSGTNFVKVDSKDRAKAYLSLAGQNLLGVNSGPAYELFDQTRLGMTDRQFDIQEIRALQNYLSKIITDGADNITNTHVALTMPKDALFKSDQAYPTASVKIITRGSPSKQDIEGIQRLVANSVPKLDPQRVVVVDSRNRALTENTEIDSNVARSTKQLEVQIQVENTIRSKLEQKLEKIVGPDNYQVEVDVSLDWEERAIEDVNIMADNAAVISSKSYEEESKTQGIAGPPGISSNVQDTGIGMEQELNGSNINEIIENFQYPWSKTHTKEGVGEIKDIRVTIAIDYLEDADGNLAESDPAFITAITDQLNTIVQYPTIPVEFKLNQIKFDDSLEREMARARLWESLASIVKSLIPLLLLAALGYFAFTFFQKAFMSKDATQDIVEEEIPIEPVTEAKELTLSQLGLSEFGDIASLPAEEQRRLKMQEHVVNFASEKPEEVAAIIKAWLSG
jgi:flagellar M-ring protein FliF